MREEIRRGLVVNRHRRVPMFSMQLRSLRVRVRALAGWFLLFLKMWTQEPVRSYFYFVCMRGAKSRRALPATEEKFGEVVYTVLKSDYGRRKVNLWRYR